MNEFICVYSSPPGVPIVPPVVNIQVARTCNLRCSFCSHHVWEKPTGFMEWELFCLAIDQLRKDGTPAVSFLSSQGESLLHPKIFDMLEMATANFKTTLVTNGTPLTAKRIHRLSLMGLAAIEFSFAGWDKESYESSYVGAKFEQVSRNLFQLILALKDTKTTLIVNGIVKSSDWIGRTFRYLKSLGMNLDNVHLDELHNWGGTMQPGKKQGSVYSSRHIDKSSFKMCPILMSTPGIYVDGRVTACGCIDANGRLTIGDIREQRISEMRRGPRFQAMINAFEHRDISGLPLCNECEIPYR